VVVLKRGNRRTREGAFYVDISAGKRICERFVRNPKNEFDAIFFLPKMLWKEIGAFLKGESAGNSTRVFVLQNWSEFGRFESREKAQKRQLLVIRSSSRCDQSLSTPPPVVCAPLTRLLCKFDLLRLRSPLTLSCR
jgi:hypothetical protein